LPQRTTPKEALMPKLTDTQLVILSTAAQRDGGAALPLPKSVRLRGAAVNHVLSSLLKKNLLTEQPTGHDAAAWRESKDGQRLMLVISDTGKQAIGIENDQAPKKQSGGTKESASKDRARPKRQVAGSKSKRQAQRSAARAGTKQSVLIELLSRRDGATIAEAMKATGWQPHSVRGAISGTLKRKLGLAVTSDKIEGRGRVYRTSRKR
jgi:Protein of unknown function (DUF3489)